MGKHEAGQEPGAATLQIEVWIGGTNRATNQAINPAMNPATNWGTNQASGLQIELWICESSCELSFRMSCEPNLLHSKATIN